MKFAKQTLAYTLTLGLLSLSGVARAASNPSTILVPIVCGQDPGHLHNPVPTFADCDKIKSQGGLVYGRLEWYSGNTLIYTENGPLAVSELHGDVGTLFLGVNANHDSGAFPGVYEGTKAVLTQPDLSIKLWMMGSNDDADHGGDDHGGDDHSGKAPSLVYASAYRPVSSALWAKHSEDTVALQSQIDGLTTINAVAGGGAGSWQLQNLGPRMIKGDFAPAFMVDLQQKDLRLVLQSAVESQTSLPATSLVNQLFTAAQAAGDGRQGTQVLFKVLGKMSGRD